LTGVEKEEIDVLAWATFPTAHTKTTLGAKNSSIRMAKRFSKLWARHCQLNSRMNSIKLRNRNKSFVICFISDRLDANDLIP